MRAGPVQENLRLKFQPPKRSRVNDPGALALKFRAIIVTRLGIFSPARIAGFLREGSEKAALVRFHFFARLPTIARKCRGQRIIGHSKRLLAAGPILPVWSFANA